MKKAYIYLGIYPNNEGLIKIGKTEQYLSRRKKDIEKYSQQKFEIKAYIQIENITQAQILLLESLIRLQMANEFDNGNIQGLDHIQTIYSVKVQEKFVEYMVKNLKSQYIKNKTYSIIVKA